MNGPGFGAESSIWSVRCAMAAAAFAITIFCGNAPGHATSLKVQVIKGCENCVLPAAPAACQSSSSHWDKAGTWIPQKDIRIHAVSIPEQAEVSIYTDIEVSTAPLMYLPQGHIFRVKYAGPGILRDPPCAESFVGSNVTTTNITFPSGSWIAVRAGQPVYVHMDVKNWSPFQIDHMTQDAYIYYSVP